MTCRIVAERAKKKRDAAEQAEVRKRARVEKARDADRQLADLGESLEIPNAAAIQKLKVEQLRAWLLVHDPAGWVENKKVKGKPALVELVHRVWDRMYG